VSGGELLGQALGQRESGERRVDRACRREEGLIAGIGVVNVVETAQRVVTEVAGCVSCPLDAPAGRMPRSTGWGAPRAVAAELGQTLPRSSLVAFGATGSTRPSWRLLSRPSAAPGCRAPLGPRSSPMPCPPFMAPSSEWRRGATGLCCGRNHGIVMDHIPCRMLLCFELTNTAGFHARSLAPSRSHMLACLAVGRRSRSRSGVDRCRLPTEPTCPQGVVPARGGLVGVCFALTAGGHF
jgi:hypothetical protein